MITASFIGELNKLCARPRRIPGLLVRTSGVSPNLGIYVADWSGHVRFHRDAI